MSRTAKWSLGIVLIVVLALVAWAMGLFGSSMRNFSSQSAAVAGAPVVLTDADVSRGLTAIDFSFKMATTSLSAFVANQTQPNLEIAATRIQVVYVLLSQLMMSLQNRAGQVSNAPTASLTDLAQNLSQASSNLMTVLDSLRTNPKLDGLALKLNGTRLQSAMPYLRNAQVDAAAAAKVLATMH